MKKERYSNEEIARGPGSRSEHKQKRGKVMPRACDLRIGRVPFTVLAGFSTGGVEYWVHGCVMICSQQID